MRIVMFYHSLRVRLEPRQRPFPARRRQRAARRAGTTSASTSRGTPGALQNLRAGARRRADRASSTPPTPASDAASAYDLATLDLDAALDGADLVIVHEWNDHDLVRRIGEHRARGGRATGCCSTTRTTAPSPSRERWPRYDLSHYDGVLAFGERAARPLPRPQAGPRRAWTWHEAADTRVFRPIDRRECEGDLVWVGNWGDEERTAELHEFLLEPVKALGLTARVHGVRYPEHAKAALKEAGIEYGGWLPNFRAPQVFAAFKVTVHVPRRPYVQALPGIPTIRVFEALACGIPLVCSPWDDAEGLFTPGQDYLVARNGARDAASTCGCW